MIVAMPEQVAGERTLGSRADLRLLYEEQRWALVRLATLLVSDRRDAEEIVQDAFVRAHVAWPRLRDESRALAYLRSAVLNGARSRLRHLRVVERVDHPEPSLGQSPEAAVLSSEKHRTVVAALRTLPPRQCECLVLRYYLELSEAEIAAALKISAGSVKTHTHRALAALAARMEDDR